MRWRRRQRGTGCDTDHLVIEPFFTIFLSHPVDVEEEGAHALEHDGLMGGEGPCPQLVSTDNAEPLRISTTGFRQRAATVNIRPTVGGGEVVVVRKVSPKATLRKGRGGNRGGPLTVSWVKAAVGHARQPRHPLAHSHWVSVGGAMGECASGTTSWVLMGRSTIEKRARGDTT